MACEFVFTESSRNVGGQELQMLQQIGALQSLGHAAKLVCRPGGAVAQRAAQTGVAIVELPLRNALDLRSLAGLRRLLSEDRPRCVICHSGHDANLAMLAARMAPQRPRVVRSKTYMAGRPSRWAHGGWVDATMVPSEFLRRALLETPGIDPARVVRVYPGIDFDRLDADARMPLPADLDAWLAAGSGPVLVQVGMLRGEKGHVVALEAMAALSATHPTLRYVAAGAGDLRAGLLARARTLGLASRVWIGELRPVAPLLARADLVLMPSLYEPLGMAPIEALGLGIPVLASRTGGLSEVVEDEVTGLLLPPGDVPAWASALQRALAQPEAVRAMAARGRDDVRQRFSLHTNTSALLRLAGLG